MLNFSVSFSHISYKILMWKINLQVKEWKDGLVSSADFVLDDDELRGTFNDNTKMIILNTPSNPLGKIYSR